MQCYVVFNEAKERKIPDWVRWGYTEDPCPESKVKISTIYKDDKIFCHTKCIANRIAKYLNEECKILSFKEVYG